MSVKATRELTRSEAEALYWKLYDQLSPRVLNLHDSTLEDMLVKLNDRVAGGEGFENYRIIPFSPTT